MRRIFKSLSNDAYQFYFVLIFFLTFFGNKFDLPFLLDNSPFLLVFPLALSFTGHPVLLLPQEVPTAVKQNRPATNNKVVVFLGRNDLIV